MLKQCSRCRRRKKASEFYADRSKGAGLSSRCKGCQRIVMRETRRRWASRPSIVPPSTKRCPRCKETKPARDFSTRRGRPDGLAFCCRSCEAKTQIKYARTKVLRRRGLREEDLLVLQVRAKGKCEICKTPFADLKKAPAIDHDHETKKVRGLLCQECNLGLGKFCDDPVRVKRALEYLVQHK